MGYNLNIGFSKEFYEREEIKEEMIYKAQIIQSIYRCDKTEVKNIKDYFDGKAYYKISLIKYYYHIDGLAIIINRRHDYASQEINDELEIRIKNPEKVVYNSMENIYEQGSWENVFENLFKTALRLNKEKSNQKVYTKSIKENNYNGKNI